MQAAYVALIEAVRKKKTFKYNDYNPVPACESVDDKRNKVKTRFQGQPQYTVNAESALDDSRKGESLSKVRLKQPKRKYLGKMSSTFETEPAP